MVINDELKNYPRNNRVDIIKLTTDKEFLNTLITIMITEVVTTDGSKPLNPMRLKQRGWGERPVHSFNHIFISFNIIAFISFDSVSLFEVLFDYSFQKIRYVNIIIYAMFFDFFPQHWVYFDACCFSCWHNIISLITVVYKTIFIVVFIFLLVLYNTIILMVLK